MLLLKFLGLALLGAIIVSAIMAIEATFIIDPPSFIKNRSKLVGVVWRFSLPISTLILCIWGMYILVG